jgi:hypothetical protein
LGDFNDKEEALGMAEHLDLPNHKYSDYLQGWSFEKEAVHEDCSEFEPRETFAVRHAGETLSVFHAGHPGPDVSARDSVLQLAETETACQRVQEPTLSLSYYSLEASEGEQFMSFATDKVINRWTTFPMPTLRDWQEESLKDNGIRYLMECITNNKKVAMATLECRRYYKDWANGQLEVDDGVLYQWEAPKDSKIRQLRRRVVPIGLRQTVYTAYHATPLAGHASFYKTYWRIAARYYWPNMHTGVRKAVL